VWWIADANSNLDRDIARFWIRDWKVLGTIAVVCATILGWTSLRIASLSVRWAAVVALVALAVVEGFYNNHFPNPKRWDTFAHPPPYMRVLQREASATRVLPFGEPAANCNETFDVYSLDSLMAYNPPRIYDFYRRHTQSDATVFLTRARTIPSEPVLDRAAISFVAVWKGQASELAAAHARGYVRRYDDDFVSLFQRKTLPRFFYSSEYRVVPPAVALEDVALVSPREIILEESPGIAVAQNSPNDPLVTVEAYRRNFAAVIVDAPRPGLLYASESFFDGWSARVNGAPAAILPANYAFRAVVVPRGRSQVTFTYWPPGLTMGLWVSGLSVALLGVALVRRPAAPSRT
jgi:hypothetical protein